MSSGGEYKTGDLSRLLGGSGGSNLSGEDALFRKDLNTELKQRGKAGGKKANGKKGVENADQKGESSKKKSEIKKKRKKEMEQVDLTEEKEDRKRHKKESKVEQVPVESKEEEEEEEEGSDSSHNEEEENVKEEDKDEKKVEEQKRKEKEKGARTIFVGNVPCNSETKLSKLKKKLTVAFKKFGPVESVRLRSVPIASSAVSGDADYKLMRKVSSIKSKLDEEGQVCNAYVVYTKREDALKAVEEGRGMKFLENRVRIDMAAGTGKKKRESAGVFDRRSTAFIGNVAFNATEDDVIRYFETNPELRVQDIRLVRDKITNKGKGIGYVLFEDTSMVELALMLDKQKFMNRPMRVSMCEKSVSMKQDKGAKQSKGSTTAFQGAKASFSTSSARNRLKRKHQLGKGKKNKGKKTAKK